MFKADREGAYTHRPLDLYDQDAAIIALRNPMATCGTAIAAVSHYNFPLMIIADLASQIFGAPFGLLF